MKNDKNDFCSCCGNYSPDTAIDHWCNPYNICLDCQESVKGKKPERISDRSISLSPCGCEDYPCCGCSAN
jgi:hypothetical protein